ncbi:hypothetical protein [Streptomyces sp. NPDC056723]|uniref:hypothetical protein n=1 Tax=Streptomyces sp. NPDC056723 TaxID=3345925 RepID=UPI003699D662
MEDARGATNVLGGRGCREFAATVAAVSSPPGEVVRDEDLLYQVEGAAITQLISVGISPP